MNRSNFIDITGKKYNFWTVIEDFGYIDGKSR